MRVLVTGAAGFIGLFVTRDLLAAGHEVVGLDNLNTYYSQQLKLARLRELGVSLPPGTDGQFVRSETDSRFSFVRANIADRAAVERLFHQMEFDWVCHLAAQAGVRYSLEAPQVYVQSNLVGFANILEACRVQHVEHLAFASSSSVYGLNRKVPYSESDAVDHPMSLYAATKKSNEVMAHSYSHLYSLPVTGLRFFTVYGPWGRPDMALFKFTKAILAGEPIDVYNDGNMVRDFTYIDDVARTVRLALEAIPVADPTWNADDPKPGSSSAPFRILNVGNSTPVRLLDFIAALENALGRKATKRFLPVQPGDVLETSADVTALQNTVGYSPSTPIERGVQDFVRWYQDFYLRQER